MASPRLGVGAAPAYDDVSTARSPPALLTSPFTLAGNRGGSSGRNSSSSRGDEVDASTAAPPAAPDAAATAAATNSFASAAPDTSNASATAPVEHVRSPSGADDAGGFGSRGAAPASSSFSGSSQTTTPSSTSAGRSNAAAGLPASERARAALLARSPSAAGNGAAGGRASQPLVLTPSRLRIDSRVLLAHTTSVWFTNSVFVLLILFKLVGHFGDTSWWVVFIPALLNHVIDIPVQVVLMINAPGMVYRQIGPPPPDTASPGLHAQYRDLQRARERSQAIDALTAALDSAAMLIVKCFFCDALAAGVLDQTSMRLIFTPFWVVWAATTVLDCLKDRSERVLGSTRDLLYLALLFVALQVDLDTFGSWRIAFLVPWLWFTALFILALVLLALLLLARVWARIGELLLPISFLLLLLSTVPQFVSYVFLVQRLDSGVASGVSFAQILVPNSASWFAMWLVSLLLAWGLRRKERVRDALLQSGAVWTMHEQVARRLRQQDVDVLQRKVDAMSEQEVRAIAREMMAGRPKPLRLVRAGNTLYKQCSSGRSSLADDAAAPGKAPHGVAHAAASTLPRSRASSAGQSIIAAAAVAALERSASAHSDDVFTLRRAPSGSGNGNGAVPAHPVSRVGAELQRRPASASGIGGMRARQLSTAVAARLVVPLPGVAESSSPLDGSPAVVRTRPRTSASAGPLGHVSVTPLTPLGNASLAALAPLGRAASIAEPAARPLAFATARAERTGSGTLATMSNGGVARVRSAVLRVSTADAQGSPHGAGDRGEGAPPRALGVSVRPSTASGPLAPSQRMWAEVLSLRMGSGRAALTARSTSGQPGSSGQPPAGAVRPRTAHPAGGSGGARQLSAGRVSNTSNLLGSLVSMNGMGVLDETLGLASADSEAPREGNGAAPSGAAAPPPGAAAVSVDALDDACIICYDGEPTCVFLECGHGGLCTRCAYLLFVRPPNECPTCRAAIDQVVELSGTVAVGETVGVKS